MPFSSVPDQVWGKLSLGSATRDALSARVPEYNASVGTSTAPSSRMALCATCDKLHRTNKRFNFERLWQPARNLLLLRSLQSVAPLHCTGACHAVVFLPPGAACLGTARKPSLGWDCSVQYN